jgi:hypothetical protein
LTVCAWLVRVRRVVRAANYRASPLLKIAKIYYN